MSEWIDVLFKITRREAVALELNTDIFISSFCFSRFPQTWTCCQHLKSEDINSPNIWVGGREFKKNVFLILNSIKLAHILFGQRETYSVSMADIILWLEQIKGKKGWVFSSYTTANCFSLLVLHLEGWARSTNPPCPVLQHSHLLLFQTY